MKHLNMRISGRVQGVFFRASTLKKATELGVVGWVKNENDGTVYIEVEGDDEVITEFLSWCHHGPEFAMVRQVETEEADMIGFLDFEIK